MLSLKFRLNLLLVLLFVTPWLSVPLIGKKSLKRFFPGSLLLTCLIVGEQYLAKKRIWWWYYRKFNRTSLTGETTLVWGPFFVSSMWILKFTYRHFSRYFLANLMVDSFYTYVVMDWFKKIGFASLVRLKKYQLTMLFVIKSLILYGLTMGVEKLRKSFSGKNSNQQMSQES